MTLSDITILKCYKKIKFSYRTWKHLLLRYFLAFNFKTKFNSFLVYLSIIRCNNFFFKFNSLKKKYPKKDYKVSKLPYSIDLTYYFLNTDFNYKFKSFFKSFLNKFMSSGSRYSTEKTFNNMIIFNKSYFFFGYLFDSLEYLKPYINIKIFEFKQKGKKKSVKKGKKEKKQVKIIPEQIGLLKSYRVAFKWLVSSILEDTINSFRGAVVNELINTSRYKTSRSLKKRNNVYKLASENRSFFHYRWLIIFY